jgi:hypothetical protein
MISASGTLISRTKSILTSAVFMASACGIVRGNPSNRYPFAQSGPRSRSSTRELMISSDTSWPASIRRFAASPVGVPAFAAARSMSPVETCGMA